MNYRFCLFIICFIVICSVLNGQYKINKKKYNYHTYNRQKGDPYNPTLAGVSSLILPGMGQILSSEPARGFAFMGGAVLCGYIAVDGTFGSSEGDHLDEGADIRGYYAGFIGFLIIDIWATVDAVRVAKVNNLATRDANRTASIMISPYLTKQATGISLRMQF